MDILGGKSLRSSEAARQARQSVGKSRKMGPLPTPRRLASSVGFHHTNPLLLIRGGHGHPPITNALRRPRLPPFVKGILHFAHYQSEARFLL